MYFDEKCIMYAVRDAVYVSNVVNIEIENVKPEDGISFCAHTEPVALREAMRSSPYIFEWKCGKLSSRNDHPGGVYEVT